MLNKHHISSPLFKQILKSVPIATVDLVVVRGTGKNKEFLLGKRRNKPYKGKWFIPGGRIFWGESLERAVARHLKRELGLHATHFKFVFHLSFNNPPGEMGIRYFTLYHVYVIKFNKNVTPKHDQENLELRWFKKIEKEFPSPVKKVLQAAGF